MVGETFVTIAEDLELAGLVWQPEIGDEVAYREQKNMVSILVDPQGLTPPELRTIFVWLPTFEQIVLQVEARQAILFHAGLELSSSTMQYKTVIQASGTKIETHGENLRSALGMALRTLLLKEAQEILH